MKRILLFLSLFACLITQAQTWPEIGRVLNAAPTSITTTAVTANNTNLFSIDLTSTGTAFKDVSITITGTWVATVSFQGSNDNFTTTDAIATYTTGTSPTWQTSTTSNITVVIPTYGYRYIRARSTAFTSGTINSTAYGNLNQILPTIFNVAGTITANAGSGTFNIQSNASVNITQVAGSSVVTAATGIMKVGLTDGSGNNINSTSNALNVSVQNATLAVTKSGTWDITNAGTFSIQETNVVTDNTAFTDGTTKLQMAGYIFDEVAGTALTENDAAAGRLNANRALVFALEDGATRARYATVTASNALKVDGSAVTQPVSFSNQSVNLGQVGGTSTVTAGVNGTLAVGGNVATNVAIGTNPMNLGAQAVSSENTTVTATRMVQLVADLAGKLITLPYANPENFVSGAITTAMTGTTSTSLISAPASGLRNYITQITVSNSHATVGTDVVIQDGNDGTTLYTIPAGAVYGGAVITFPVPLRQPTTATAIYCKNLTTGASTKVSASGYKGF